MNYICKGRVVNTPDDLKRLEGGHLTIGDFLTKSEYIGEYTDALYPYIKDILIKLQQPCLHSITVYPFIGMGSEMMLYLQTAYSLYAISQDNCTKGCDKPDGKSCGDGCTTVCEKDLAYVVFSIDQIDVDCLILFMKKLPAFKDIKIKQIDGGWFVGDIKILVIRSSRLLVLENYSVIGATYLVKDPKSFVPQTYFRIRDKILKEHKRNPLVKSILLVRPTSILNPIETKLFDEGLGEDNLLVTGYAWIWQPWKYLCNEEFFHVRLLGTTAEILEDDKVVVCTDIKVPCMLRSHFEKDIPKALRDFTGIAL